MFNSTAAIPVGQYLRERELRLNRRGNPDPVAENSHEEMLINHIMTLGLLGGMAASSMLTLAATVPTEVTPEVQEAIRHATSILDDGRLLAACFLGSFGGGFLSTLMFPLGKPKEYASKIVGSALAGVLFSPKILYWLSWTADTTNVVFLAGAVSFLSWSCLQPLVPVVSRALNKWVGDKFKSPAP